MSLSNWLTRDEWNAAYFAGIKVASDGTPFNNLSDQLRLGIAALHGAGYQFQGISIDDDGGVHRVTQVGDGNERVLAELMKGSFDVAARALETLAFAERTKLSYDFSWLAEALNAPPTYPTPN